MSTRLQLEEFCGHIHAGPVEPSTAGWTDGTRPVATGRQPVTKPDGSKPYDKLKDERDSVGAYVDAHKALISPARRLPLDRNCVMSATEAPVILGRICSSWRAISLSTPRLWSKLHVVEPLPPPYPHGTQIDDTVQRKREQRVEITKTWLGRSGHCPLSISLHCTGPDLMESVLSFVSRWEHVDFTVPPDVLLLVSHLSVADVPLLKSLAIQFWTSAPPADGWGSWGLLHSPQISQFSFRGTGPLRPLDLPLRWDHLKDLCFSIPDGWNSQHLLLASETAFELVSRCPSLKSCQLCICQEDSAEPISTTIFEHSSLRTFDLTCTGSSPSAVFQRLLHRLSLPGLRHFVLRAYGNAPVECHLALPAAAPCLESVDINVEALEASSVPEFFRSLPPTLRKLHLIDVYNDRVPSGEILELLTPSLGSPSPYCPGLEEFHIPNCFSFSDAQLLRFVQARMTAGLPLKRLSITFTRAVQLSAGLHNLVKSRCGVRVKAFSRAPPGPTREPDQDFTSSVLGPTITLSITARGPFIEKEWRRTNFVTFLRLIFERVGTIDIAWEWLRDSYLCVGIQLKPFGHALAWNTFNANQSRFRFFRHGYYAGTPAFPADRSPRRALVS
ncbi:hypothetical protein C8R43DRAFT_950961 [Mycena crocata]|nr:hypothetical protein C8R43DRAFT_950961 [Mycena crocata]